MKQQFICRVCGYGEFAETWSEYMCVNCTTTFSDPSKFSTPKFLVSKLHEDAVIPTRAMPGDAGYDLHSIESLVIRPEENRVIRTGLKFDIPSNYMFDIRSRSGLAAKRKVFVMNSPGTIDSSYVGELKVILFNADKCSEFVVNEGDRIAQLIISPVSGNINFVEIDIIDKQTERGEGGFGHTG